MQIIDSRRRNGKTMETKKYKLTEETKVHEGRTLHRIQALRAIPGRTYPGEFGGWVGSEYNLSHYGDCWVAGEAMVYGNARVIHSAYIAENAQVYCDAKASDDAHIKGKACVGGRAMIYESAYVYDNAKVGGVTKVSGNARIHGNAHIKGRAQIGGNASVRGCAIVSDNAIVHENAMVYGGAKVYSSAVVGNWVHLYAATWGENPIYIQGTKYPMWSPDKQGLAIGCQNYSFEYWRKRWKTIARLCNEDNKGILEECRLAFNLFVTRYGDGITIDSLED